MTLTKTSPSPCARARIFGTLLVGARRGRGLSRSIEEAAIGASRAARLDSLVASIDSLNARLQDVRDASIRRVGVRTEGILETCRANLLWLRAMHHLYVD